MKVEEFIAKYSISFQKIKERQWGSYEIAIIFFNDESYVLGFQDYVFGWGYEINMSGKFILVDFVKHQLRNSDTNTFIAKFGQGVYNDFKELEYQQLEDFWPDTNTNTALVKYV